MKKPLLIFAILVNSILFSLHHPPIVKRPCYQRFIHEAYYSTGFDSTYRKKIGEQYLREMLNDQKHEREQVESARLEKTQNKSSQSTIDQEKKSDFNVIRIPVPPRKTAPTCTHLRTAKNSQEIARLITIKSILPEIYSLSTTPRITQFDIQPQGSYSYKK